MYKAGSNLLWSLPREGEDSIDENVDPILYVGPDEIDDGEMSHTFDPISPSAYATLESLRSVLVSDNIDFDTLPDELDLDSKGKESVKESVEAIERVVTHDFKPREHKYVEVPKKFSLGPFIRQALVEYARPNLKVLELIGGKKSRFPYIEDAFGLKDFIYYYHIIECDAEKYSRQMRYFDRYPKRKRIKIELSSGYDEKFDIIVLPEKMNVYISNSVKMSKFFKNLRGMLAKDGVMIGVLPDAISELEGSLGIGYSRHCTVKHTKGSSLENEWGSVVVELAGQSYEDPRIDRESFDTILAQRGYYADIERLSNFAYRSKTFDKSSREVKNAMLCELQPYVILRVRSMEKDYVVVDNMLTTVKWIKTSRLKVAKSGKIQPASGKGRIVMLDEINSFHFGEWLVAPKLDGIYCTIEYKGGKGEPCKVYKGEGKAQVIYTLSGNFDNVGAFKFYGEFIENHDGISIVVFDVEYMTGRSIQPFIFRWFTLQRLFSRHDILSSLFSLQEWFPLSEFSSLWDKVHEGVVFMPVLGNPSAVYDRYTSSFKHSARYLKKQLTIDVMINKKEELTQEEKFFKPGIYEVLYLGDKLTTPPYVYVRFRRDKGVPNTKQWEYFRRAMDIKDMRIVLAARSAHYSLDYNKFSPDMVQWFESLQFKQILSNEELLLSYPDPIRNLPDKFDWFYQLRYIGIYLKISASKEEIEREIQKIEETKTEYQTYKRYTGPLGSEYKIVL
jgi:hypothetical protein